MLVCYFALPELNFCSPHDIIADLFTLYSHRKIPGTLIRWYKLKCWINYCEYYKYILGVGAGCARAVLVT